MNNPKLRKLLHGIIIKDFCTAEGIQYTKENAEEVKQMFKGLFGINGSTEALGEDDYRALIHQIIEVSAVEFGHHLPLRDDDKTMEILLNETNQEFKEQNDERIP